MKARFASRLPAVLPALGLTLALAAAIAPPVSRAAGTERPAQGATFSGNYLAGRFAQNLHDTRSAAMFLGRASEMTDENPELLRRAYVLALSEGNINGGLEYLRRIKKLEADAPLAEVVLAVAALKQERFDEVEKIFADEKTGKSGINAYLGPVLSAWAMAGNNNAKAAVKHIEAAKKDLASPAFAMLHMGLVSDFAGDIKAAEKHYRDALKEAGMSLRLVQHLGNLLERSGRADDARKLYEEYDNKHEGHELLPAFERRAKSGQKPGLDIDSPAKGAAEALFGLGSSLSNQGADESAMVMNRLALYLRGGFYPAMAIIAGILDSNERYAEANTLYRAIGHKSPMYQQAQLNMSKNLDLMGNTDDAIRLLQARADERPDDPSPLIELGDTLRRNERFNEAAAAYDKAIARIARYEKINDRHWGIYYSRGIALERSNKWDKAEKDFLRALEMQPDQPFVLNYLGYSWLEKKINLERAIEMIQKAVELRPRDGYIVDSLGWGLYQTGKYPQAVKSLERAVMLRPEDPVINDHLGDAFWQVGRKREARFQWERALSFEPEAKDEEKIKLKLKSGLPAAVK